MADDNTPGETRAPQAPVIDLEAETISDAADAPVPLPPAKQKSRVVLWGGLALAVVAALAGGWLYRSYGASLWPTDAMVDLGGRMGVIETTTATLNDQVKGLGGAIDQIKTDAAMIAASADTAKGDAKSARDESSAAATAAAALTGRVEKAESALAAAQSSIAALQSAISGAAVTTTPTAPADTTQFDALALRVAELEKIVAALKSNGAAGPDAETAALLSQTLSDFKAKLANGAPYTDELARLRQLVPAAPGIDDLAASAASGLPTAAMLADQLAKLGPTLPGAAPATAPADDGTWGWITSMLDGIVTVRDIGEANWRDVAARAEGFAAAGNLEQAIDLLSSAEGDMPAALAAWLASARARIAGDDAVEAVSAAVLRQIAALGGAE